jgi:hypothetical protein
MSNFSTNELLNVFKSSFEGMNLARISFISHFIIALCKVRSVNLVEISAGFDNQTKASSNYRRIQNFLLKFDLSEDQIYKFIFSLLPNKNNLILALDRTNWKFGNSNINILLLGACYKNICFPLMFKILDKRGNSNTEERIELISNFIRLFGKQCIDCLLADREFIGSQWCSFLNENGINYHIRIKKNFQIYCCKEQIKKSAYRFFDDLKPYELRHQTRKMIINDVDCYISGMKTINNGKVEYCLIISFKKQKEAFEKYKQRWQIEMLFKGFKSSGFNVEKTHITDLMKLKKLFLLVMVAFVWCYKIGDLLDSIKPIQIKTHGRKAISVFKYGLDYLVEMLISKPKLNTVKINIFQLLSPS